MHTQKPPPLSSYTLWSMCFYLPHQPFANIQCFRLGSTLMHEHVLVDYAKNFGPPTAESERSKVGGLTLEEHQALWEAPLTTDNLGHVHHYFNQARDLLLLNIRHSNDSGPGKSGAKKSNVQLTPASSVPLFHSIMYQPLPALPWFPIPAEVDHTHCLELFCCH